MARREQADHYDTCVRRTTPNTRNRNMSEAKATKAAEIMSRETGKACKVIHLGNNKYTAVIVGSTRHLQSVGH
jgi:hypothetical protein